MEENPSFDLNQNIQQWRATLLHAESLREENVEELELHLRDSVAGLERQGLSPEEAFLIAAHRIGGSKELANEFTKVNQAHIWRSRLFWMLGGLWMFQFIGLMLNLPVQVAAFMGIKLSVNAAWVGVLCSVVHGVALLAVCYLGWRLVTRRQKLWNSIAEFCQKRPTWAFICLVLLALSGNVSTGLFRLWQTQYASIASRDLGSYYVALSVQSAVIVLLQNFMIPFGLIYLFRKQRSAGLKTV